MLNFMIENESKRFTNISILSLRFWWQMMVFIFVFRHVI